MFNLACFYYIKLPDIINVLTVTYCSNWCGIPWIIFAVKIFGWFYYCIVPLGYGDMTTLLIPKLSNLFEFTISTFFFFFFFFLFPILSLTSPVIPFNLTPLVLYLPSSPFPNYLFIFFVLMPTLFFLFFYYYFIFIFYFLFLFYFINNLW